MFSLSTAEVGAAALLLEFKNDPAIYGRCVRKGETCLERAPEGWSQTLQVSARLPPEVLPLRNPPGSQVLQCVALPWR